jgi:hypothetical protein
MRSPLRAFLVALVATLGFLLVTPGVAHAAKSKTTTTTHTKSTKTTTKRVVKHPWSKNHQPAHAKAQAKPHRVRTAPATAKHPWKKS